MSSSSPLGTLVVYFLHLKLESSWNLVQNKVWGNFAFFPHGQSIAQSHYTLTDELSISFPLFIFHRWINFWLKMYFWRLGTFKTNPAEDHLHLSLLTNTVLSDGNGLTVYIWCARFPIVVFLMNFYFWELCYLMLCVCKETLLIILLCYSKWT